MKRQGSLVVGLAMALVLTPFAGCAGDDAQLVGLQRTPPLEVGTVSLPEVTNDDASVPFRFVAAPGTLLVVYFGFTNCPDLCPTTLADLRSAGRRIGDGGTRIDLALVTVDPARDTPDVLRRYAGSFADKYHVIRTTDTEQLRQAQDAFLASSTVSVQPDGTVEVSHTATAYVIDGTGRVLVEWPFGIGAKGMANDLEILIKQLKETTT